MLRRLGKLSRAFRFFMHARIDWRWPQQCDLLVFDAELEVLSSFLKVFGPALLHVRGERLNLPVLATSLLRPGKRLDAYLDCYIQKVRPRLIATLIDNNSAFHSIAMRHPGLKTLFVQNGSRGAELFEELDRMHAPRDYLKVDYMLTFGSRIGAEYSKRIQGQVIPMGSLRNNLVPRTALKKAGTIAFISQFRNTEGFMYAGRFHTREEFFERADRIVLGFLTDYARRHDKQLVIVPCTGHYQDNALTAKEHEYYRRLVGAQCAFSEWRWQGSSYDAVDTAEVVVGIDSTLGVESAARGNKTAFFTIRSQLLNRADRKFGWPCSHADEGAFWTNRADAAVFERILDHLFTIDQQQWQEELSACGYADIMNYDPGNTLLSSILKKELGSAPVPLAAAGATVCV